MFPDMDSASHELSRVLIELGLVVTGLAVLARLASRLSFSAVPLYLLAGLAFGNGGLAPLNLSAEFTHMGAEIGVLLLLFMLGLEYSGSELIVSLSGAFPAAIVDLLLNFTPGFVAGFFLKWKPLPSILLGGVTYVSSSGIIAKILSELQRLNSPETPAVLSVLVMEDFVMAVYLPLIAVLIAGGSPTKIVLSVSLALVAVLLVLALSVRYGAPLSRLVAHQSDEIVLLTVLGLILLVAGAAQRLQVSAAIGAFLVGIAISEPISEKAHRLLTPLRDLFAATFFFFFGLQIVPVSLLPVLGSSVALGIATAATKFLTGFWAGKKAGVDHRGRLRAGMALVAHGEFSILIAGLGVSLEPQLGPLSAGYVLFLAVLGPILARAIR